METIELIELGILTDETFESKQRVYSGGGLCPSITTARDKIPKIEVDEDEGA